MPVPQASVIIAAAGAGRRFIEATTPRRAGVARGEASKVFVNLGGRPVLAHVLSAFAAVDSVVEMIVAVSAETVEWAGETFGGMASEGRRLQFIAGGGERIQSVALALEASDRSTELVAIHDAVRPLIRPAVIAEAMRVAVEYGAAVVGRPIDHTIKTVTEDGLVAETVPRRSLWMAQTPQVFRREIITQAYGRRGDMVGSVTDDAQLVEAMGQTVMMVPGDTANVKITTPEDLRVCEAILAAGWPFEQ